MKFAHLGVYVADLSAAVAMSTVFDADLVCKWENTETGLAAQEYDFAGINIEFLHQEGRNNLGIDHVAFSTVAFEEMRNRLITAGAAEEQQITSGSGKRISFLSWNNLRIELMEN